MLAKKKKPTTGHRPPATSHQPPATGHQPLATATVSETGGHWRPLATGHLGSRATSLKIHDAILRVRASPRIHHARALEFSVGA